MSTGRPLSAQVVDHLLIHEFRICVQQHGGNHRVRTLSCWAQQSCIFPAQFTSRESRRDIVACLGSADRRLYHPAHSGQLARSTSADANELRDWRIYADSAQVSIRDARALYRTEAPAVELAKLVYAFDSTMIDTCMLFPQTRYKTTQRAVKLHTLLDLRGTSPRFSA